MAIETIRKQASAHVGVLVAVEDHDARVSIIDVHAEEM